MIKKFAAYSVNLAVIGAIASVGYTHHVEAEAVEVAEATEKNISCLAKNIYFENHGRSEVDAYAVSDVIMNRVEDSRYPNTICGVVQQSKQNADGSVKRDSCQFSWYCDGKTDKPAEGTAWDRSMKYAVEFYEGKGRGISQGSNHYHSHKMVPYWADDLDKVGRIGNHIFYRWN